MRVKIIFYLINVFFFLQNPSQPPLRTHKVGANPAPGDVGLLLCQDTSLVWPCHFVTWVWLLICVVSSLSSAGKEDESRSVRWAVGAHLCSSTNSS